MPSLDKQTAQSIASRNSFDMSPDHRGFLFENGQDLYYATFDGSTAVRLTNRPGREQWPKLSPDGKAVAFVRDYDLYVVDIASQTELRLTTGGRDDLRHAQADWVYFEEIFNRRWPAFWWSPDSKRLAFLEFDSGSEPLHTVLDDSVTPRRVEQTRYPRSGEPNPKVRLGLVASSGGVIQWADFADYSPESFLISEVGWFDGSAAYCYVQNRTQTWLDLVKVTPGDDRALTRRLFRDSTKAWIESPGPLHCARRQVVRLAQRAGRLEAPLPLRRRWVAQSPAHLRPVGDPRRSKTSILRPAGATSPPRATTPCLPTFIASSPAVRSSGSPRQAAAMT